MLEESNLNFRLVTVLVNVTLGSSISVQRRQFFAHLVISVPLALGSGLEAHPELLSNSIFNLPVNVGVKRRRHNTDANIRRAHSY